MNHHYLLISATYAAAREVRVAAERLAAVDPDVDRTIVVVDEDPRSLELLAGLGTVLKGSDLGMNLDEVGQWAGAYGAQGVMWVAFPHILRAVGEPGDHVLWLGADLHVVGPPDVLWDALESNEVIAGRAAPSLAPHRHDRPDNTNGTPYALQPVTAVVKHDGELVARSLLGWVAGSPVLERALAEWPVPRDTPTHESLANAAVAQQWFNALALGSDVEIVAGGGVVLSIAQLLAREIEASGDPLTPLSSGAPLSLLSLRGFDPREPHLLEGKVRTARVSERPALAPILRGRAEALLALGWEPHEPFTAHDTRWSVLAEGLPLSQLVQDLVRAGQRAGAITASPFTPEGFEQLRDYVIQPARQGGSIGVNRLLGAVHSERVDLQAAYPALDGPDGLGFLGWAWVYGKDELSIPESFLPPRPAFLDAAPPAAIARTEPDTEGVNLAGYFTSELGLGESARQIAAALDAAGVAATPVQGLLVPPTRQQAEFQPVGPQDAHHDVNVIVVNGDQMPSFAKDVGPGFFDGRTTIGVWWWEVDPFPFADWAPAMEWIDEIWVGTEFIRSLIEPHVDVPVWVFPVPVAVSKLETPLDRAHFGFGDDETIFLYVWDYHSTEARKNPSGLVEAYRRAFPDPAVSNTRLVLKCINHENLPEADEKVRLAAAGRDDIQFIDRFLSGREKNGLLELCDCYVSPHRSEGFGYTPAEAMLLGKPVVVTNYGGTTEYTDDQVARLVQWQPSLVGRGALPYPPDGRWADPDLDDLAAALQWIVAEPEAVAAMAARGEARVRENHGIETTGQAMKARLEIVRARHAGGTTANGNAKKRGGSGHHVAAAAGPLKRRIKRKLGTAPGARRARSLWWRLRDRTIAVRTTAGRTEDRGPGTTSTRLARLEHEVASLQTFREDERHAKTEAADAHLAEIHAHEAQTRELNARLERIEVSTRETQQQADAASRRTEDHLVRHSVEPFGIREAGLKVEPVDGIGKALGGTDLATTGDRYADFLAVFRGPYDRVLDLMRVYAPLLKGQGPLLDLGCGRGELLEVAEGAGIEATGIDLDAELVEQAKARGRTAKVGDAIEAVRSVPDASVGAISAIHVIEHLPVDALEALFTEARRALKPGGLVIFETINPHEVSAAATFWVDPTHRGPVFPEVALALALSSGFSSAHVFAPDGTGDWDEDRTRSTRYALVARA